ncbi:inner-membrane translocator (plasmid) [Ilyobacter polytropus DSM 2926]|uniref:Inner-membrane translocator n=1 Tax=Ilyobacter polytropus (strain ATCC 51220 / DSM 2926 / LMG 16218 / CuHBu1) TaxID=572544 RepID=E3HCL8_ILYPC|nr:inner-membrane translocator [Ilyobacter polytropus DSM 2926]
MILLGTLEQGLIFSIMVLGVYISYKILDFPDLSVDGSFPLGAAVAAVCVSRGMSPVLALLLAVVAGGMAGFVTGYIHVKWNITNLLAGIIVMTGLYSVNLRVMGKSNIPLFGVDHLFNTGLPSIVVILVLLTVVKGSLDYLLKTKFGFALKALGDNETLVVSLGINEKHLKIYGLAISNALVALSGGILAQYQGFADVGMGTGTIVTGLAAIIIGETVFKTGKFMKATTVALLGTLIFKYVVAAALKMGMRASDLKLVTAVIVVGIMALKEKKKGLKRGVASNG